MRKGIGRKRRKQKRKKSHVSLKVRRRLTKEENDLAWEIAKVLTKMPRRKDLNIVYFCPICEQPYCISFVSTEVYCDTCYYARGCIKKVSGLKTCKKCGGVG